MEACVSRSFLAALWLALACGEAPRFAPPPADIAPPERGDLVGEDLQGEESAVGLLPRMAAPALRCMVAGADGRLLLPPLGPRRALNDYDGDIACLVRALPPAGQAPYVAVLLEAETRNGPVLLAELPLAPAPEGAQSRLVWLSGPGWRERLSDEEEALSLAATLRCDAARAQPGCDLRLSRSVPLRPAAAPPAVAEPKSPKGAAPRLLSLRCAGYDDHGMPLAPLEPGASLEASAGLRCELAIENPTEEVIENARAALRLSPPKGAAAERVERLLPRLLPGARFVLQMHLPAPALRGEASLAASVGRNASERSKSERSLRLNLRGESPDAPEPVTPSSAPTPPAVLPDTPED